MNDVGNIQEASWLDFCKRPDCFHISMTSFCSFLISETSSCSDRPPQVSDAVWDLAFSVDLSR